MQAGTRLLPRKDSHRQCGVERAPHPFQASLTLMFTPSTTTSPRLVLMSSTVPTLPLSPPAITCDDTAA